MRLLPVLMLSVVMVAATAHADDWGRGGGRGDHGDRGGDHGGHDQHGDHAAHAAHAPARPVRYRRSAPHPMRYNAHTRFRPAGAYRPPTVRFNLHVGPAGVSVGWRAPIRNPVFGVAAFAAGLALHASAEVTIGHTYWHSYNGTRYAHYYDGHVHWYGFYDGPRFYWSRYDDGRWWWFDETHSRWLYWYGSYWWWHDPANAAVPYVVINDSYYPYSEVAADPQFAPGTTAPAVVEAPADAQNPAPPSAAPAAASPTDQVTADANAAQADLAKASRGDHTYVSPDKTREVRVMGAQREAFLYDDTGPEGTHFVAYLGKGVRHAEFSEPSSGKLQVLLVMSDGSYDIFDVNGRSMMQSDAAAPAAAPANGAPSGADNAAPPSAPPSTDEPSGDAPGAPPSAPPGQ